MPGALDSPCAESLHFGALWKEDAFDAAAVFRTMHGTFSAAARSHPADLCHAGFRFAGRRVRMSVVGRELFEHIVKPFAHLRCDDAAPPELAIDVWDDRRVQSLPVPEREQGEVAWRETTLCSDDDRFIAQRLPHTTSCLDRRTRRLVAGIAWHDRIFIYERSKPFARALLNWYNDGGLQLVHAGLVSRDGAGVLLAGKSGSGKSTSALACAIGGQDFLGEDYVALETHADGSFTGHSVYSSVFLKSGHLGRFDALARHAIHGRPPQEEKSVVLLSDVASARLARSATLRALVFPRVGDDPQARIAPIGRAEALLALAPSSLFQIPNRQLGAAGFARLAQLVERVPCFRMTTGSDLASIPRCLDAVLAQGTTCAR
jgi:hypothetical protein